MDAEDDQADVPFGPKGFQEEVGEELENEVNEVLHQQNDEAGYEDGALLDQCAFFLAIDEQLNGLGESGFVD